MVSGKLRVRDWDNGERSGTSVEVEADSIGHDLSWGSAVFTRTVMVRESEPDEKSVFDDAEADEEQEKELVGAKKR